MKRNNKNSQQIGLSDEEESSAPEESDDHEEGMEGYRVGGYHHVTVRLRSNVRHLHSEIAHRLRD